MRFFILLPFPVVFKARSRCAHIAIFRPAREVARIFGNITHCAHQPSPHSVLASFLQSRIRFHVELPPQQKHGEAHVPRHLAKEALSMRCQACDTTADRMRTSSRIWRKADSTLRSSQAVPHPSTDQALRCLTSEVKRDPVHSTRYGRRRQHTSSTCSNRLRPRRHCTLLAPWVTAP